MHNVDRHLVEAPQPRPVRRAAMKGFTLIELMVVVAVIGILMGIAIPSYQESVRKGRRGQAKADLVDLAQRSERFHTINGTYVGFWATVPTSERRSPRGTTGTAYYTVSQDTIAAGTFRLNAAPQNDQLKDTRCGTLRLTQAGVKTETGTGTVSDCW